MTFNTDFLIQLFGSLIVGAGAYAAIKADLATTRERATEAAHSARRAHERIDKIQSDAG